MAGRGQVLLFVMGVIVSFFQFVWSSFGKVWDFVTGFITTFSDLFTRFTSSVSELLEGWGIYDTIYNSLDTLNGFANSFNSLVSSSTMAGTITSFFAFDTLYAVVLTVIGSTFGVLLAVVALFLGVLIPAIFAFISFRIMCRVYRFVTAGIFKP